MCAAAKCSVALGGAEGRERERAHVYVRCSMVHEALRVRAHRRCGDGDTSAEMAIARLAAPRGGFHLSINEEIMKRTAESPRSPAPRSALQTRLEDKRELGLGECWRLGLRDAAALLSECTTVIPHYR